MTRIKELQKQKQVRDAQIEQLVHNLNELQDDVNLLEQENQILRYAQHIKNNIVPSYTNIRILLEND